MRARLPGLHGWQIDLSFICHYHWGAYACDPQLPQDYLVTSRLFV